MANQYTKKKEQQRKEITWNLVNSGLAGGLVMLGSMTAGTITWRGFAAGIIAGAIVAMTKFWDYWSKEEKEYSYKIFSFGG